MVLALRAWDINQREKTRSVTYSKDRGNEVSKRYAFLLSFQVIIPLSWSYGVLISCPVFLVQYFDSEVNYCIQVWPEQWMGKAYSFTWFTFTAFLPVSMMIFLYSRVVYTMWFNGVEPSQRNHRQQV